MQTVKPEGRGMPITLAAFSYREVEMQAANGSPEERAELKMETLCVNSLTLMWPTVAWPCYQSSPFSVGWPWVWAPWDWESSCWCAAAAAHGGSRLNSAGLLRFSFAILTNEVDWVLGYLTNGS